MTEIKPVSELLRENLDLKDALRAANDGLLEALVHISDEQTRLRLEKQIAVNNALLNPHGGLHETK